MDPGFLWVSHVILVTLVYFDEGVNRIEAY